MATQNRVALFLDGTWNTTDDNTNVWRLKALCSQSPSQKVYYSAGVGTQYGEKVIGGMFGIGINEEVISAYEWLVENWEDGNQILSSALVAVRSLRAASRASFRNAGS